MTVNAKRTTLTIVQVDPKYVEPPHDDVDWEKVAEMVAIYFACEMNPKSAAEIGLAPIVIVDGYDTGVDNTWRALNGTHRLAAAVLVGTHRHLFKIDAVEVTAADFYAACESVSENPDDILDLDAVCVALDLHALC